MLHWEARDSGPILVEYCGHFLCIIQLKMQRKLQVGFRKVQSCPYK